MFDKNLKNRTKTCQNYLENIENPDIREKIENLDIQGQIKKNLDNREKIENLVIKEKAEI